MLPSVQSLDHLVLTVADPARTVTFYTRVLGMQSLSFAADDGAPRQALRFGNQKVNLHVAGAEFDPKARHAGPGTADLCFLSEAPIADWQSHLAAEGVKVEEGPVRRTGATGPLLSLYIRDPDGNLIEVSNRL